MGHLHEDNLPEVVPPRPQPLEVAHNSSPQAVPAEDALYQQWQASDHDKFHVAYDNTPKLPTEPGEVGEWPGGADPNSAVTAGMPPWEPLSAVDTKHHNSVAGGQGDGKTICGFKRRIFFTIIAVVALVVIAAAVGGGVGGANMKAARESAGTSLPVDASSSSSLLPTTTSTSATSTSSTSSAPSPTITFLNNQTSPIGLAFQGWSGHNYTGRATPILREEGFYDFGFNVTSYIWIPNSTECCINFCVDKESKSTGYWCDPRRRREASSGFPRIRVWCGANDGIINTTCS